MNISLQIGFKTSVVLLVLDPKLDWPFVTALYANGGPLVGFRAWPFFFFWH